jgi:hypothetical protein
MKLLATIMIALCGLASMPAHAADTATKDSGAQAFEHLKSLAGEWESTGKDGQKSRATYEVISGGSAVVEHFVDGARGETNAMLTVFHLDGGRLLLTHYCMAHNQPRMQAESFDPATSEVRFAFLDATGMSSPAAGHMHSASYRFTDANHFTTVWQFVEAGKPKFTETVEYTRVR